VYYEINHNYYGLEELDQYYNEYHAKESKCEICNLIVVTYDMIAHETCVAKHGLGLTEEECNNQIEHYLRRIVDDLYND